MFGKIILNVEFYDFNWLLGYNISGFRYFFGCIRLLLIYRKFMVFFIFKLI